MPVAQHKMPADEYRMVPAPVYRHPSWHPCGLLAGKRAIITGGDSGIGRAVALLFASEGADIVLGYLEEDKDAEITRALVEEHGRECLLVRGDISRTEHVSGLIEAALVGGGIDVLVSNAGIQYEAESFIDEDLEHIDRTVAVNVLGSLYLIHAALPHLSAGASVIVTTSVTAYRGSDHLVTYAATKGALVSLVRSLGPQLAEKGIRVNGVAPGPVWTPLIAGSFDQDRIDSFGKKNPMGRAAQPYEIAPSYLFLASASWSGYITGQVVHPNGGETVNA